MDGRLALELFKLLGAAIGFLLAVYMTFHRVRENRMASERGLEANPERCGEHRARIVLLEKGLDDFRKDNESDHGEMFRQLRGLSIEVAKLGRNGNRGGGAV